MQIDKSKIWQNPRIAKTILKNIPILDPFTVLFNSDVYVLRDEKNIYSFATIKKFGSLYELGTVFTYPQFRKKGHASEVIKHITSTQSPIFVLCKKELMSLYEKSGFVEYNEAFNVVVLRKKLFNIFLSPLVGYKLICLKQQ